MKLFQRVLFYFALILGVLVIGLTASVSLYKDRILSQFIREANKQLNTPITIKRMDVSVFQEFPQLSIVFHDVYVEDSHPGQYPLLTAKTVSFQLNPIEVWSGDYTVKGMQIRDSETHLKINKEGLNNFTVIKKKSTNSNQSSIGFELADVSIENTVVHYVDVKLMQNFTFTSNQLIASIHSVRDVYDIEASGELAAEKLLIGENNYLNGKSFQIESHLIYDDVEKKLIINPSDIRLKTSAFSVTGEYGWKNKNVIDLTTKGTNTDIQTLLSLLPESKAKNFEKYKSDGEVYFNARLMGEISQTTSPMISVDFGFKDATIYHPDYRTRVEEATLTGSFASSHVGNLREGALVLKNITGRLNREDFQANFVLHDFVDPEIMLDFKGKIDAPSLLDFYPVENLNDVSGSLLVDIAFEGKINLLKNKATAQRVSTLGTVDMQDINLLYGKDKVPLQHLGGNLQFSNNDLALSNVSGKLGNSDFLLNGFFKNIITFLLFENQPIGIETDLKARFIDLNQLFALGFGNSDESTQNDQYTFRLSRHVNLNFNCDIKSLKYKRFHAKAVLGDLLVKNQMAVSRNLSLNTMGGNLKLSGIVDGQNPKAIDVVTTLSLNGIHLDSAFYVFENFNQTFIQDKHLKGRATADINLEMTLNQNLRLFQETLIADIGISIAKGELNNFEPLKKLERYVGGEEGLNRLRFSELKNDIHIENKSIYLPMMEVRNNVTDIKISGTHTFDQRIDYRLITPLRRKRIVEADAQNAMEEDSQGHTRLFLKVTGTTDDYRISYDTEAVKKKIVSDLKREVQELKDAFKTKGKKKDKELELDKEDYFEWER
ncbi:MAG: AsmA-like C-terminal region-containing protein [Cyclobacteriaceae bacterium]